MQKIKAPVTPWTVTQLQRNSFRIHVPLRRDAKWEQWVLLTSDRHWDNPHSDWEMQRRHLEEAKKKKAPVLDCGDMFCLMQGKFDKRHSKSGVRPEHQRDDYFQAVTETAVDFFKPYAHLFVLIGTGNHEEAIQKRHEYNFIDGFLGALNMTAGSRVYSGGYAGYVSFQFQDGNYLNNRRNIVMRYEHGAGGDSPVTADAIAHFRQGVYYPDADIICSGHNHHQWVREIARQRLSPTGKTYQDLQTHIKIPTYKEEFGLGDKGWHVTTRKPPKPLGAWWLRLYWHRPSEAVRYDVIHAR